MTPVVDILDILTVGVFVLDNEFRVAKVNRAMAEFFGLDRDAAIGSDKRTLIRESVRYVIENPEEFQARVFASYDNNTSVEEFVCHVLPGPNRCERWLEHRSHPITKGTYAGGRLEQYVDITDRVQAEDEINWISTQFLRVQEREKARIAGNLHDELGQSVVALKFMVEAFKTSVENGIQLDKGNREQLDSILKQTQHIGHEISRLSGDLMPSTLDPLGLEETLPWLCDAFSTLYGINIEHKILGLKGRRLHKDTEIAVYRIFQEALNNVVKHAPDSHVQVTLTLASPWIIAHVRDNGPGFDTEAVNTGAGLRLMRRRVAEEKGQLTITSAPGRGTTVRARIPVVRGGEA